MDKPEAKASLAKTQSSQRRARLASGFKTKVWKLFIHVSFSFAHFASLRENVLPF
jgi:hypothetical protein